jgi:23S rRNA pseudouridine1911/1915/1917 synthase
MQEWTVADADADMRLDLWLTRRAGAGSRSKASAWLDKGKVFLNGEPAGVEHASRRVSPGDRVGVWMDRPGSARAADRAVRDVSHLLQVVHEDAALVAVDKAVGLIVEPLPGRHGEEVTVLDLLAAHLRADARTSLYVVHRIDRDTSGLVIVARTPAARDALKAQFEERTPERVYLAVVQGRVVQPEGTWQDRLAWDGERLRQRRAHGTDARGKDAIAHYAVLEQFADAALLRIALVTGKRNQIRVQASLRGHALLGERQYRFDTPPPAPGLPAIDRQALHAWQLGFVHPTTGRLMRLEAPLPEDLTTLLDRLRGRRS